MTEKFRLMDVVIRPSGLHWVYVITRHGDGFKQGRLMTWHDFVEACKTETWDFEVTIDSSRFSGIK